LANRQDDFVHGRTLCEESLALAKQTGDRRGQALVLMELGTIADALTDWSAATTHFEQCLPLFRDLGDRKGVAATLQNLGNVRRHLGDCRQAAALYEESLAIARELGNTWSIAMIESTLGLARLDQGEYGRATAPLEESLVTYRALGDKSGQASVLEFLARVAIAEGSYDRAVKWLCEALPLSRQVGRWRATLDIVMGLARAALMQGVAERSVPLLEICRDGWRAYGYAWGEANTVRLFAMAARRAGEVRRARELCGECLRLFPRYRHPLTLVVSREEYALAAMAEGRWVEGARLCAAAAAWREQAGTPRWASEDAELEAAMRAGRLVLEEAGWQAAWMAGRARTPAQALDEALAQVEAPGIKEGASREDDPQPTHVSPHSLAMIRAHGQPAPGAGDARAAVLEQALAGAEALCAALSSE
jgi:tetratricopeptide (TPR) repeat protein